MPGVRLDSQAAGSELGFVVVQAPPDLQSAVLLPAREALNLYWSQGRMFDSLGSRMVQDFRHTGRTAYDGDSSDNFASTA